MREHMHCSRPVPESLTEPVNGQPRSNTATGALIRSSMKRGLFMSRTVLGAVVVVLAVVAAIFAYQAYQRDQNSLQIEVGPQGVKVDPPG